MSRRIKIIASLVLLGSFVLIIPIVMADNFGINVVNNTIALSSADPRFIIGRIIQIALTFLGVIVLFLIIYAGFLWMTSGGDEEKIKKSKNILKNAIIGLIIVLSAWGITTFLLNKLSDALSGNNPSYTNNPIINTGLGAIGACTVDNIYPESNQNDVARNSSIITSFKENIKLDTLCVNASRDSCSCDNNSCNLLNPETIRIYKSDFGDACSITCPDPNTNISDVFVSISSDHKTIVLTPLAPLGSPDEDTWYTVDITSALRKEDGFSMFQNCSNNGLKWKFKVNTNLDLTPPEVSNNGIFPHPDNLQDVQNQTVQAQVAMGKIIVNNCPHIYMPATVVEVTPNANVVLDYHGDLNAFKVSVPADNADKAQLFNDNNNLLGIADWVDNQANFNNYFSINTNEHPVGSLWTIKINPEQKADTLTVGSETYNFADSFSNNNILVHPNNCLLNQQATAIGAKLSGHPDINIDIVNHQVLITAKVAGKKGNSIVLSTTSGALGINKMSGGSDMVVVNEVKDRKDNPMNSVIQINFNEAINPVTLSGTTDEISQYIRIINAQNNSLGDGASCNNDLECLSYNCSKSSPNSSNSQCVGNYLDGKFILSNAYKTVEFVSNKECGVNGCGEKIYCLPANSHLTVELVAANLKSCTADSDCIALGPYNHCINTSLGYKTCQNSANHNYPIANRNSLDGIVDVAMNSLDGNRDTYADGPIDFFNENHKDESDKKDKYKFSFYVNDQIMLAPPQITVAIPPQGTTDVSLYNPITVTFNTLMMNSSLRTGSVIINNGMNSYEHKLINLRSFIQEPLGYWITNENKDVNPLDGTPDLTVTRIKHSTLSESVSYKSQIGSGVKDIYQNCYKPSVGPNCLATTKQPSCCFGTITNTLGANGNCQ